MKRSACASLAVLALAVLSAASWAVTYEVGDGKPYASIGAVPWESINAGDTVLIYYRAAPYREKFPICRVGTPSQPITVRGVPGPGGELPVIDGENATTRLELSYMSESRGIIYIGYSTIPQDCNPSYIVVENLEVKNAHTPYSFTDESGASVDYTDNAAAFFLLRGQNITIRNCVIHDCGNGIFTYSERDGALCWTQDILLEGNYLYNCGVLGSNTEHDSYCESYRITYQYNHYGPPIGGDTNPIGNALKDRSAGMVARYNWFEGGNRGLDLVEPEDSDRLGNDPLNHVTYVYGNVVIERNDAGNRQMIHYGGDMHGIFRAGWLYLYNNTLVSWKSGRTTMMRLSTNNESCDLRNNVVLVPGDGSNLALLDQYGILNLTHNWFKPGWIGFYYRINGIINDDGTSVYGASPGFVNEGLQDYHLAPGSQCINAGTTLNPACLPDNDVVRQYVKERSSEARPADGLLDIGAFEAVGGPPADLVITTTSLPSGQVGAAYSATLQATGGVPPYAWSVLAGSLPAGLALNGSTGVISGTPAAAGASSFTVQVLDMQDPSDSDTKALSITVNPAAALNITTTSLPNARRNRNYSQTLAATGGVTPYTWSVISGSLPQGLTLNAATGVISGKASTIGVYNFTVRCTDSQTPAATDDQMLSITVTS